MVVSIARLSRTSGSRAASSFLRRPVLFEQLCLRVLISTRRLTRAVADGSQRIFVHNGAGCAPAAAKREALDGCGEINGELNTT
jgi:hypothetical protein